MIKIRVADLYYLIDDQTWYNTSIKVYDCQLSTFVQLNSSKYVPGNLLFDEEAFSRILRQSVIGIAEGAISFLINCGDEDL